MRYLICLLLALFLGLLQGCFPIIATGVGTGALMASDRRTTGTYIEDEGIELKAVGQVGEKYGNTVHVNVTSFNRRALITGEAPTEEVKNAIGQIMTSVQNVKSVSNELAVSGLSSLSSRGSDTLITSDVKLRFLSNGKAFQPEHIKVVTENGVVYLMGLVYHKEADAATEIASSTKGVQRVVKVFEYLD
jgi:osmotically-inducible protein OsmY